MCGANGAASSDALSVIGAHQCVAMVHSAPHPHPPLNPPLAASVVRSECLSVDKAERAASAAHLG